MLDLGKKYGTANHLVLKVVRDGVVSDVPESHKRGRAKDLDSYSHTNSQL